MCLCALHNLNHTYHLQQSQITSPDIVKVDFDILPAGTLVVIFQNVAFRLVVDNSDGEALICGGVDAVVVLPCKKVDAHDAED